jgi:tripartite-type tricarboxylate transporter receptor subunit TctC
MRYLGLLVALIVSAGATQPLLAQDYPTHPVRILVQFPPGGVPDLSARLIADQLSRAFGKPFVAENRPGTGGNIATEAVARSEPDGHTLLLAASAPLAINPALYKKLPFDVTKDLKPISLIASFDFVMLAAPGFPPKSVADVVALAKQNPGKYNFASSGFGSEHHLSGELFSRAAGIQLTHVPYKGFGPATADVMASHVELMFGAVPAAMPFIKGGKLRPLATTGTTRDPSLPDVPTFAELGYPQVKVVSWVGLLAPARTPKPIFDRLVAETTKAIQSPEFKHRLETLGLGQMPLGPQAMAAQLDADQKFWAGVVKQTGLKQVE